MSFEQRVAKIDRFAGLSDRSQPSGLTRIENPALLNIDFSERKARRRFGYTRVNSERLRDGSIRLDGKNDYLYFRNQTAYRGGGTNVFYVSIGCILHEQNPVTVANIGGISVIASMGDLSGGAPYTSLAWQLYYDPALGAAGGWGFTVYDGTTQRTSVISDANLGVTGGLGEYRHLEGWIDNGGTVNLLVRNEAGDSIGGTGAALTGATLSSAEPILIGVTETAPGTIGTWFSNMTVCEFRYWVGAIGGDIAGKLVSDTDYGPDRHIRELIPTEYDVYTGYWKLNDGGRDGVLEDQTTTGNNGVVPENPASWVSTDGEVLGPSGVQFFGFNAFVALWEQNAIQYLQNPFNTVAVGQFQRWTVRGIFVPKLATGESTVRDQTIFWAGTSATIPAPVALQIISNTWVASYRDGATTRTCTISAVGFTPTALVGKRVRFALTRSGTNAAASDTVRLTITYINSSDVQQTAFANTSTAMTGGASPSVTSGFWFLGRHVTSVTQPYTYASGTGDLGAYGVIDDFQVVHTNSQTAAPVGTGGTQAFTEKSAWGAPHFVVAHLKLNEGGGYSTVVYSEVPQTLRSFLYPEPDDGAHWDVGLVRPYRSPECGGIFEFDRFDTEGNVKRVRLIQHGLTWSELNTTTGVLTPIGATNRANGKWTKAQYAQVAFLAGENGQRPLFYDGSSLDSLGIQPPLSAPVLTNGAGGTFSGSYYFYVTYYNKHRAIESNPGPGVPATLAAATITQVVLPISPDPQVTGRRLYMTLPSGADGSLAFLLQEFDDNTQGTWGAATTPFTLTTITAPVSSGRALEYFDREEAPITSIARVNGDNLFLAGDPVFPTRIYRSSVGEPWYFNWEDRNVDLDLDSGDPITGFAALVDSLFVGLRDGWGRVWNTGDSTNPIGRAVLSRDHGPVGANAMVAVDRIVYYLSERDIYRTDGLTEENVSSPPRPDYPSIQETMKSGINALRRKHAVMAYYKGRKQLWVAYSSASQQARNDKVIVYEPSQGVWSIYEMTLDFITEIEDDNDSPTFYGASEGYIVKLDQSGTADGVTPQRVTVLTYTSGECPQITYSGAAIDGAHGAPAFCYKKATNTVVTATCEYSEAGILRFYKKDLGLAAGDIVIVGAIRDQMDYLWDFGECINRKRMTKLQIAGEASGNDTYVRLQWAPKQAGRSPVFSTAHQMIKPWPAALDMLRFQLGGLFRTARVRISLCDDPSGIFSDDPWPSTILTAPVIYEIHGHAEVMDVD